MLSAENTYYLAQRLACQKEEESQSGALPAPHGITIVLYTTRGIQANDLKMSMSPAWRVVNGKIIPKCLPSVAPGGHLPSSGASANPPSSAGLP